MISKGLQPKENHYFILIKLFASIGDFQSLSNYVESLQASGYTSGMISLYCIDIGRRRISGYYL